MADQDNPRVLGLSGATNFRDFGGYPTSDGRQVRWRHLYRSNKLSALSAEDRQHLDSLAIHTVFDLRARHEREADPTCWSHGLLRVETYPSGLKRPLVEMAQGHGGDEKGALALMAEFYGSMPRTMPHVFGGVIRSVANGASPCIIHCSAGKDRTGIACALILTALGVPREIVMEDYVLTQSLHRPKSDMDRAIAPSEKGQAMSSRFTPAAIDLLMASRADYLATAFATMKEDHGSIEGYIGDALDIDGDTVARLKERLLEPLLTA
jgi:protein-tyrosine phosphatase